MKKISCGSECLNIKLFSFFFFLLFFIDDKTGTLDGALDNLYCRSQMYLSRQISRLRPELTMPIFSGKLVL